MDATFVLSAPFIAHVANLYPEPFAAIESGRKVFEYRLRARPDRVIASLVAGTPILFRECGSERGLLCRAVAPPVVERQAGRYHYAIPLVGRRPVLVEPRRKHQGWHRMTARWVGPGVVRVAV